MLLLVLLVGQEWALVCGCWEYVRRVHRARVMSCLIVIEIVNSKSERMIATTIPRPRSWIYVSVGSSRSLEVEETALDEVQGILECGS